MSTTTTSAVTATTLIGMLPTMTPVSTSDKHCPTCGQEGFLSQDHSAEEAQQRIKELEEQVQLLNTQAGHAADKLALYEDELRRLRAPTTPKKGSSIFSSTSNDLDKSLSPTQLPSSSPQSQPQQSRLSTLTSFLPYRRTSTTPPASSGSQQPPQLLQPAAPPIPVQEDTLELQNALSREQDLRKAAESQLSQASTELEELTVQLFSQANEMVAQERKARARLEERVALLERRDVEKRKRLDRLEKAMARVERVRTMIG